jgi:hypothetical protein
VPISARQSVREADCKESLPRCQHPRQSNLHLSLFSYKLSNITITRRLNALALYQEFAQERISAGESPKGLEQAFAGAVQVSPSMWSQVKASRPIGDKLARQFEQLRAKTAGWLDVEHGDTGPSPAEERLVEAARQAWQRSNAKQKRELARWIAAFPPEE